MAVQYLRPDETDRLRKVTDPERKWLSDEEIKHIMVVSAFQLNRAVVRCFMGIQQKARVKNDSASVVWARNQLNRFEAGFLQV